MTFLISPARVSSTSLLWDVCRTTTTTTTTTTATPLQASVVLSPQFWHEGFAVQWMLMSSIFSSRTHDGEGDV
ncbi:hypothetical protein E2C01_024539 [Portunus trituberculatus]|uniref:Uncharacterized protein n=1 Tax=Portunus trituberculatus TaxID=210409 RepID=A0A5B7ECZ7_PORTR|nr:hypothetical protein [Portunus trituberculatus]